MTSGWSYRLRAVGGVIFISALAVTLVNNSFIQTLAAMVPLLSRLPPDPPGTTEFTWEMLTTVAVFTIAFLPLYRPRPRRTLDTIWRVFKRTALALVTLAAIGYFDYTYRIPRLTLLLVTPLVLIALPTWFAWIRRRPTPSPTRALIVGDDPQAIATIAEQADFPIVGFLCPTTPFDVSDTQSIETVSDGGTVTTNLQRLGGLSRIEDIITSYDIDTVILAFETPDRAEFFGALDACYEHGVTAKVHRNLTEHVLLADDQVGTLVDVAVEPWDVQDYLVKRGFDIAFATAGLLLLLPVMLGISIAIKLEDGGSILYAQERTAIFGETFTVYKFRTMIENAEAQTGATISAEDAGETDPRVTAVGQILRPTHLDEIPQLLAVLQGNMSVVGPRPERPELEPEIRADIGSWQKRWFVKPGLTGPAQVNGVTGTESEEKIRYDLTYIRNQSFTYDLKLVVLQIWKVLTDAARLFKSDDT